MRHDELKKGTGSYIRGRLKKRQVEFLLEVWGEAQERGEAIKDPMSIRSACIVGGAILLAGLAISGTLAFVFRERAVSTSWAVVLINRWTDKTVACEFERPAAYNERIANLMFPAVPTTGTDARDELRRLLAQDASAPKAPAMSRQEAVKQA